MARPTALIVDDDLEFQQKWLTRIARACLPGWQIHTEDTLEGALALIPHLPNLRVAIVDLYLTVPATGREGLQVVNAIRRTNKSCYTILVSSKVKRWEGISGKDPVDKFVSLVYESDEEPEAILQSALTKARMSVDFPDAKRWTERVSDSSLALGHPTK